MTLVVLTACGRSKMRRAAVCTTPDSTVPMAVTAFIKDAKPTPQRFLSAAGTDSALPDAGLLAMQDKGPTYLFPANAAQQASVRKKLASIGNYSSLLVIYHGTQKDGDSAATVMLGGRYVGDPHEGETLPRRSLRFACDSAGWHAAATP